jgi:hypothetical protein
VRVDVTSYVVNFEDLSIRRGKTLDFKLELTAITKGSECALRRSKDHEPTPPHAFVLRVDAQHVRIRGASVCTRDSERIVLWQTVSLDSCAARSTTEYRSKKKTTYDEIASPTRSVIMAVNPLTHITIENIATPCNVKESSSANNHHRHGYVPSLGLPNGEDASSSAA